MLSLNRKPKRLVLFVEGKGDERAVRELVRRSLGTFGPQLYEWLYVDEHVFRVKGLHHLTSQNYGNWKRFLGAACKRDNLGGVFVLLDGDTRARELGRDFCPVAEARNLVRAALDCGAGARFSLSVVFAIQEFESWMIAGYASLPTAKSGVSLPTDVESAPRDAKGWLARNLIGGYSQVVHQYDHVRLVDLNLTRNAKLRSFRRFESALSLLVASIRDGQPIVTPIGAT